jgi:hypothetical protein
LCFEALALIVNSACCGYEFDCDNIATKNTTDDLMRRLNNIVKSLMLLNYFIEELSGVIVTGPSSPDESGSHADASNKPFLVFSFFRAGILVL